MNTARAEHESRPKRGLAGFSFGTRLLVALSVVVVGCAVSAWLVASALAPSIFRDHLARPVSITIRTKQLTSKKPSPGQSSSRGAWQSQSRCCWLWS